ncbi:hypothetical protein VP1G_03507 [Cytospora mali]|uniref:Uncharacterized protein n=1 Tax=Cytospora mali TaxID=578113 RepID=A0A194UWS1_CYTMA|nr:hypothetical protein VP1G_03507 [Valsa mali var. pyri (nom. inval.)]
MAPLNADDVKEFQEAGLSERRVQSLGWAFTGVPQKTAHGDDHTKTRVEKLGFAFTQVPMNTKHEDRVRMSKEEQDAVRARLESEQATPARKMSEIIAKADVGGLRPKWSWVNSPIRGDWVVMKVIEDTGSANSWISRSQIKHLELETNTDDQTLLVMLTGQAFTVREYVDVIWSGKDLKEGVDRFWVAPLDALMQMLIGREFTRKYPEVFMEEFPVLKPQGMLLTMQAKMQASGSSQDAHAPGS